jgi:hypothetical protein
MVAMHGDVKVCGMFSGAGDGLDYIKDEKLRDEFAKRITDVEEEYMAGREVVCNAAIRDMDQIFRDMVKGGKGRGENNLKAALDYVAPKEGR